MNKGKASEWLQFLDQMKVGDDAWNDPAFVDQISWVMLMFIWRRLNQRLIDAGYAVDLLNTH